MAISAILLVIVILQLIGAFRVALPFRLGLLAKRRTRSGAAHGGYPAVDGAHLTAWRRRILALGTRLP